tara:strand:- start:3928 stop:4215 length:288 start_codon:yes stop_codon:yes gene_type:complete
MNLLQLNPPIPVETPMGEGLAQIIIDYSPEYSIHWVVFLRENGQCWTFTNEDIRAQRNITAGRLTPEKPERLSLKNLLRKGPSFLETDEDIENLR